MFEPTYKILPDFYPKAGDLITDAQLKNMEEWKVKQIYSGEIYVDFLDPDGSRADWFYSETVEHFRFKAIRIFDMWQVKFTSYQPVNETLIKLGYYDIEID